MPTRGPTTPLGRCCAWTSSQCSWCGRLDVRSRPPRSARGASITSTSAPARRRSSCSASPWLDFGGRLRARAARSRLGARGGGVAGGPPRRLRADHAGVRRTSNTHTRGAFYEVFEPARARALVRRIEFCHTPKHGSWLNVAESELSCMTRQCLKDRRIGDIDTLRDEIAAWSTDVNNAQRGVDWHMGIGDARRKLKSVYPQIKL